MDLASERARTFAILAMLWPGAAATAQGERLDAHLEQDLVPHLERYCFGCHGAKRPKGGVQLEGHTTTDELIANYRLWRKVAKAIEAGAMPPKKRRRKPDDATRREMTAAIHAVLDAGKARKDPGRPVLRRLNRRQYDHTLRDLFFGLPFRSARQFPEDPQGYGFDTTGDVLFSSPMLIEKYLDVTAAAMQALRGRKDLLAKLIPRTPSENEAPGAAAEAALRPLLRRGFRRPPTQAELVSRRKIVESEIARGQSFQEAMLTAFRSVILSPWFLFRVEADRDSNEPWALSDHELAVRLSYLLWSTMPDARLFALAEEGKLHRDEVLRGEVRRMLDDPRSRSLADEFGAQWLGYREILSHATDVRRFRGFHTGVKRDLYEESARFFDDLVRSDRAITALLDADYSFLNARLAAHYGIRGVKGRKLRRVKLPDRRRGGVLGMGSVLASTSYPLRTSPVLRGKWILENLLGDPPSPPPPDAGQLPADDKQRDRLTLRQRLERHRRDARCAACHAKMDPLGFALEKYDGIGRWRTENHGREIDARAELPDGTPLDGPVALKDWLLGRKDVFVRTAAQKLLIYALGRDLELPDEKTVDAIVATTRAAKDRTRKLIEAVVMSYPFRHRRSHR